jgi:hypothetical protein
MMDYYSKKLDLANMLYEHADFNTVCCYDGENGAEYFERYSFNQLMAWNYDRLEDICVRLGLI